ncbi:hypothetical protein ACIQXI_18965 [Lysinibacillus sp. NPDC097195]|uniref:hypothetical protein n=1 Tax=Lysinibacillus sp. NPDC097195 TaxID=3364141 RepID=UPI0037F47A8B
MSEIEQQKLEVDLEQIVRQFMKNQLMNGLNIRKGEDNSFAFLEKNTLQLLLGSLLSGDNKVAEQKVDVQTQSTVVKELDDLLEENKMQFEDILDYLKSLS